MKVLAAVALGLFVVGCGRIPLDPSPDPKLGAAGSDGGAGSPSSAAAAGTSGRVPDDPRVPQEHRQSPICPPLDLSTRAFDCSSQTINPAFPGLCNDDSQCTAGRNGRCVQERSGNCGCAYDKCVADDECPAGMACACNPIEFGNYCVMAGCQVDADCGSAGFCGPVVFACAPEINEYRCHTAADMCLSDSDCPAGATCRAFSDEPWQCHRPNEGVICNG